MAILKNLLVNGVSRFLNTAYFQDVSIGGTASFTSLSADHVSVGYVNNSYALSAKTAIIDSWIRTTGSTGWYN